MPDRVRGVPRAAKVNVLEREVGGDQQLLAAGNIKDGAVVADALHELGAAARCGSPNSLDELEFFGWHLMSPVRPVQAKRMLTIFFRG